MAAAATASTKAVSWTAGTSAARAPRTARSRGSARKPPRGSTATSLPTRRAPAARSRSQTAAAAA
eukprot:3623540-Rhodomonas_salina.1